MKNIFKLFLILVPVISNAEVIELPFNFLLFKNEPKLENSQRSQSIQFSIKKNSNNCFEHNFINRYFHKTEPFCIGDIFNFRSGPVEVVDVVEIDQYKSYQISSVEAPVLKMKDAEGSTYFLAIQYAYELKRFEENQKIEFFNVYALRDSILPATFIDNLAQSRVSNGADTMVKKGCKELGGTLGKIERSRIDIEPGRSYDTYSIKVTAECTFSLFSKVLMETLP